MPAAAEQQNSAQHSLPSGAAWQDNSQIDISAVVKDLQAGKAATGAQTDSKQPDSHGNNGSDCPDADDASEEACEGDAMVSSLGIYVVEKSQVHPLRMMRYA